MGKRPYAPGMHGNKRNAKQTQYCVQLREKQKIKRTYGVLERQFRLYYEDATRTKGATGRTMLQSLERRLDNAVYRLLWAASRAQARQMVRHGLVTVNGIRVDIPSYQLKANDKIEVSKKEQYINVVRAQVEANSKDRSVASWLYVDAEKLRAEVLRLPEKEDIGMPLNEQLVVELYSK
jgi:small subunit ribosomal protein S4